jgi:hypothetical protein
MMTVAFWRIYQWAGRRIPGRYRIFLKCLDKRSATEVDGPASGGATFTRSFNKPVTGINHIMD